MAKAIPVCSKTKNLIFEEENLVTKNVQMEVYVNAKIKLIEKFKIKLIEFYQFFLM
jgi:hypothetical protein